MSRPATDRPNRTAGTTQWSDGPRTHGPTPTIATGKSGIVARFSRVQPRRLVVLGALIVLALVGLGIGLASTGATDGGVASAEPTAGCDATVAENESIQDAVDTASPHETVCLEDGTFDQQVAVHVEGLTLQAAAGADPVLDGSGMDGVGVNITAPNVTVRSLTVLEYGEEGVLVHEASNATVVEVNASHNGWLEEGEEHFAGIALREAPDATVLDSVGVDNGMQAVRIEPGSHGAVVENVTAIGNYRSGIWAGDADDVRVANSTGIENGLRAIHVEAIDAGSIVTGATVRDNEAVDNDLSGIRMIRAEGAVVGNNSVEGFDDGDRAGITVDGDASGVSVLNNHLEDGERGIFVGTDGTTVEDNTITGVGEFVTVRADDVTLTGNDASDATTGYAIGDAGSAAHNVTVVDERISVVSNWGIRFFEGAEAGTVTNVTIEDAGTGVRMGNADGTTVEHSEIVRAERGVYQVNASAVSVRHNEILESSDVGYESTLDNPGTVLENNTIAHGSDGIEDSGATGITVVDNDIVHNTREGVSLASEGPVVTANNLSNNRVGVENAGAEGALIADNHVQATRAAGIEVRLSATNATVSNNTVLDSHHDLGSFDGIEPGILIGAVETVTVANNTVERADRQGIAVDSGATGIEIDGNDLGDQPVDVLLLASNVTLTNNTVETGVDLPERGFDPFPADFLVHGSNNAFADGATLEILNGDDPGPIDPDARQVLITGVTDETLTAGQLGAETVPVGLFVSASTNVTVANATIAGAADAGVRMAQVENATLAGVDADGAERAVLLEDAAGVSVVDATLDATAGTGLEAVETPGLRIESLHARATSATAIEIDGAEDLVLAGVLVEDYEPDITQYGAVEIDGATNGALRDSVISGSTARGLDVSDSDGVVLENVTVEHADQGVWLDGKGVTVRESTIQDNDDWGLRTSYVPDAVFEDASFLGNDGDGLVLRGPNVTVRDSEFRANENGVVVELDEPDVVLENNHIAENTAYGLRYGQDWPDHNVTATDNYWGAESGPSGDVEDPETGTVADGDGDVVDEHVLFDPWSSSPPEADVVFSVAIEETNEPIVAGETLTVEATIQNAGSDPGTQEVVLEDFDGQVVDSRTLELDPGESESITLQWNTDTEDGGEDEVTVRSDDDADSVVVTIEPAAEPADFQVEVNETNSPVVEGEDLEIEATVTNAGEETGTQEIELEVAGEIADTETVSDLEGGEQVEVILTASTDGIEPDTYDATVSSDNDTDTVEVTVEAADDDGTAPPPPPPPSEPDFELDALEAPETVQEGTTFTATVELSNVGDEAGTTDVVATFADLESVEKSVELEDGDTETLEFEFTADVSPDEYDLLVEETHDGETIQTSVTVEAVEDEDDDPPVVEDDTDDDADDDPPVEGDDPPVEGDAADDTEIDDVDDLADDEADDGMPGFGIVVVAVALAVAGLAVRARSDPGDEEDGRIGDSALGALVGPSGVAVNGEAIGIGAGSPAYLAEGDPHFVHSGGHLVLVPGPSLERDSIVGEGFAAEPSPPDGGILDENGVVGGDGLPITVVHASALIHPDDPPIEVADFFDVTIPNGQQAPLAGFGVQGDIPTSKTVEAGSPGFRVPIDAFAPESVGGEQRMTGEDVVVFVGDLWPEPDNWDELIDRFDGEAFEAGETVEASYFVAPTNVAFDRGATDEGIDLPFEEADDLANIEGWRSSIGMTMAVGETPVGEDDPHVDLY